MNFAFDRLKSPEHCDPGHDAVCSPQEETTDYDGDWAQCESCSKWRRGGGVGGEGWAGCDETVRFCADMGRSCDEETDNYNPGTEMLIASSTFSSDDLSCNQVVARSHYSANAKEPHVHCRLDFVLFY